MVLKIDTRSSGGSSRMFSRLKWSTTGGTPIQARTSNEPDSIIFATCVTNAERTIASFRSISKRSHHLNSQSLIRPSYWHMQRCRCIVASCSQYLDTTPDVRKEAGDHTEHEQTQ